MTYRKQRVFTQVELAAVSRRTCAAFTLVELLVVVSIIALLVTMLMPSLMEGVRHARKVKCKVNLREIPRACVVYALENRYNQGGISRSLPSTGLTGGWNSGARANRESLWKLVDLRMLSPESLVCPALDESDRCLRKGRPRRARSCVLGAAFDGADHSAGSLSVGWPAR